MREKVININDTYYGENEIKQMSVENIKMLISFVDNEKDLNWIKHWSENPIIECYIDNLISKL